MLQFAAKQGEGMQVRGTLPCHRSECSWELGLIRHDLCLLRTVARPVLRKSFCYAQLYRSHRGWDGQLGRVRQGIRALYSWKPLHNAHRDHNCISRAHWGWLRELGIAFAISGAPCPNSSEVVIPTFQIACTAVSYLQWATADTRGSRFVQCPLPRSQKLHQIWMGPA